MNVRRNTAGHKLFFRLFPPPKVMLRKASGVDISDRAVRFVELKPESDGFTLGRFGEVFIPQGVVEDGMIKDSEMLKEVLVNLRKEYRIDFVNASLPEEKAYLFRMKVPTLSSGETYENIAFQLEEYVPIKASEAYFDFEVVKEAKEGEGGREVMVSVFPKEIVEGYLDVYTKAGLTPLAFEMEDSAIARALVPTGDMGTYMLVDFGYYKTGITIVSESEVQFTTTIDFGSSEFIKAISNNFKVNEEEAEKMYQDGAFSKDGEYSGFTKILLDSVRPLEEDIDRHYIYWHNHSDNKEVASKTIDKIIICGEGASMEGIAEHMTLTLRRQVETANIWQNAFSVDEYLPPISKLESLSYATALGLALRED